jgi:hypothetical protein
MKIYKENDIVIYTDNEGNSFDTFVIFDTDRNTGLTHINHNNLRVDASSLKLHANSLAGNTSPFADSLSFFLFNSLKEKYMRIDKNKALVSYVIPQSKALMAKAS